jgi:hypothetical protein
VPTISILAFSHHLKTDPYQAHSRDAFLHVSATGTSSWGRRSDRGCPLGTARVRPMWHAGGMARSLGPEVPTVLSVFWFPGMSRSSGSSRAVGDGPRCALRVAKRTGERLINSHRSPLGEGRRDRLVAHRGTRGSEVGSSHSPRIGWLPPIRSLSAAAPLRRTARSCSPWDDARPASPSSPAAVRGRLPTSCSILSDWRCNTAAVSVSPLLWRAVEDIDVIGRDRLAELDNSVTARTVMRANHAVSVRKRIEKTLG